MRRLQPGPLKDFDSSFLLSSQLSRPTCAETLATPSYVGSYFSSLGKILIEVKRCESSGTIAAIFCFGYN